MINGIGHFRVWRELFTKPIWLNSTAEQQAILITLMAMANFQPREWEWQGEKFSVASGQFVTSLEAIRVNTGGSVSIQNVRTALKRFEKLEFLTNKSTKTGRLITLVNWEQYQYTGEQANKDTNKDLTKTSQRPNKDLTTREESKKVIKKELNIYGEFKKVKLTNEEHLKLIENLGENTTRLLIDELDVYKASTGKSYKSDYATILNWHRKNPDRGQAKPTNKETYVRMEEII